MLIKKKLKDVILENIHKLNSAYFTSDNFLIIDSWNETEKFGKEIVKFVKDNNITDEEYYGHLDINNLESNKYEEIFEDCMRFAEIKWGFSEEYASCSDCYCAIRISPDSWGWTPDYVLGDDYIVCGDCAKENKDEYIKEYINNTNKAVTWLTEKEIEELGFKKLNEERYETGFHRGQNDSPEKEIKKYENKYNEIIFTIDAQGQFETHWSIWGRN